MITTTKGLMNEAFLEKREGGVDNENECTTWVEYWHHGELIHRSATIQLKRAVNIFGETAAIGG